MSAMDVMTSSRADEATAGETAAWLAAIFAVQVACLIRGDDTAAESGPGEDWLDGWSSDRRCEAEENLGRRRSEW